MKPGELIEVILMNNVSFSPQPTVGMVLSARKRNTGNYLDIKMLCNTGKIREFILGPNDVAVKIL